MIRTTLEPLHLAISAFAHRCPPRSRYLVGVSGGLDSVALLHLLLDSGFQNLVVCHLNHGLRGRDSGQDASFVRRLATRLGLPCEVRKWDVAHLASTSRLSLEDAGRRARLAFFAQIAKSRRCRSVILAHHADDQVETILINLGRGSGTTGLHGMQRENVILADPTFAVPNSLQNPKGSGHPSPTPKKSAPIPLTLLRPLLGVPRRDLATYLELRNLPYREDASNSTHAHLRNRIRHRLIPEFESVFRRDVKNAILRAATLSGDDDAFLNAIATEAYTSATSDKPHPGPAGAPAILLPTLDLAQLRTFHTALQRRVIHRWLTLLGIPDLAFRDVEAVRSLVPEDAPSSKVNLPRDLHARRKSGHLFVTTPPP